MGQAAQGQHRRRQGAWSRSATSGWTLPIPIVKHKAGWQFDVAAGADEMRTRRIGRNELATMQAILAYYDAQREYSTVDHNGDGVSSTRASSSAPRARRTACTGKARSASTRARSARCSRKQKPKGGAGYYGYHYKILTGQGKDAPGGAYDYIIGKRMRSGFAGIAWPVRYGDTGVMSFMVSHAGIVYEKDLGPNSEAVASAMTPFNPDASWKKSRCPDRRCVRPQYPCAERRLGGLGERILDQGAKAVGIRAQLSPSACDCRRVLRVYSVDAVIGLEPCLLDQ